MLAELRYFEVYKPSQPRYEAYKMDKIEFTWKYGPNSAQAKWIRSRPINRWADRSVHPYCYYYHHNGSCENMHHINHVWFLVLKSEKNSTSWNKQRQSGLAGQWIRYAKRLWHSVYLKPHMFLHHNKEKQILWQQEEVYLQIKSFKDVIESKEVMLATDLFPFLYIRGTWFFSSGTFVSSPSQRLFSLSPYLFRAIL